MRYPAHNVCYFREDTSDEVAQAQKSVTRSGEREDDGVMQNTSHAVMAQRHEAWAPLEYSRLALTAKASVRRARNRNADMMPLRPIHFRAESTKRRRARSTKGRV